MPLFQSSDTDAMLEQFRRHHDVLRRARGHPVDAPPDGDALAFGDNSQANRMRITRAMERGALDWVPDPSVANPQHNKRVLRSQVEQLRARRHRSDTSR